jgi:hypothetical protein
MATDLGTVPPVEPIKKFRVWLTDKDNRPYELVGEYDTVAEVRTHPWRQARRHLIEVTGKFNKFYTLSEFNEWVKENPGE